MSRPAELDSADQLALFAEHPKPVRWRRRRAGEETSAEWVALANAERIRPAVLRSDQRLCPGCDAIIRRESRNCGRRWCDSVRPTWGRTVDEIVRAALAAYCELYGGDGRVLSTVLTCTHKPGWWDTGRCGHLQDGSQCSGPAGCRVRPEIEERERGAFPARSRAAKKMARTEALRKLKRAGYDVDKEQAKRLGILMSVVEDQQRGLPHEHVVTPHTTAIEIAFTRAFFDALPRAARHHELGHTDRYRFALAKQGRYHARQFHGYLAKLARYLAKSASAGEFLRKHHAERVFYVAPWLTELSGLTMTLARVCRRVWAARHGFCEMPCIPAELVPRVERLVGSLTAAAAAP
jgi:hypothetical protein